MVAQRRSPPDFRFITCKRNMREILCDVHDNSVSTMKWLAAWPGKGSFNDLLWCGSVFKFFFSLLKMVQQIHWSSHWNQRRVGRGVLSQVSKLLWRDYILLLICFMSNYPTILHSSIVQNFISVPLSKLNKRFDSMFLNFFNPTRLEAKHAPLFS